MPNHEPDPKSTIAPAAQALTVATGGLSGASPMSRSDVQVAGSVLLIDDNNAVLASVGAGLVAAGFRVELASNGRHAISRLHAHEFDWVVTDIFMPDIEGFELIRAARRLRPNAQIIAMSGGGLAPVGETLRIARLLGARHVIQKPFSYFELVALLKP